MSYCTIDHTLQMHYEDDCYIEPWKTPETVVLLHGITRSGRFWYPWVPVLGQEYRVLRPDLRGFGRSSVPPEDWKWSVVDLARDLRVLLDRLDIGKVHLVAESFGGTVALQFAYDYPDRLLTLTLCGGPYKFPHEHPDGQDWAQMCKEHGVEWWARETVGTRVDPARVDPGLVEFYWREMGKTSRHTAVGILTYVLGLDLTEKVKQIRTPTLILNAGGSKQNPVDNARVLHQLIHGSEIVVFEGVPHHIHSSMPEECIKRWRAFVAKAASRR